MGKDHHQHSSSSSSSSSSSCFSLRYSCCSFILLLLSSFFSFFVFLYWSYFSIDCHSPLKTNNQHYSNFNLLTFPSPWNALNFPFDSQQPPPRFLKIALFVKKWPDKHHAGGLERHASTLHLALAKRGHQIHVFTSAATNITSSSPSVPNLHFHLSNPTPAGYLDQATIWTQFLAENATARGRRPFDVVHTESVGLMHTRSRNLTNLAASWHGIAYESIHSDIIQDHLRDPDVARSSALTERVSKVVEEVKFFPRYAHHVATSDHVGDVLKRIYMLPEERVHIILNGVDEEIFKPDERFSSRFVIDQESTKFSLILGIAGRLVKDKGHPLMFEALQQIFNESTSFRDSVLVLVAGDGPWGARYKQLGSNLRVLGPIEERADIAGFYNAIDVFVNPTLRAQGLDHTLLEAMLVGKPLMATKLASITGSVIVSHEIGYTFSPTVEALKRALYEVWRDGRVVLRRKGGVARERALRLFTAAKMAAAYERLFLCIAENGGGQGRDDDYCTYKQHKL